MSLALFCFGKPLSGKTTFCKKIQSEFPDFIYLNSDDIRKKYFNNPNSFDQEQNKKAFTEMKKQMKEALLSGKDIIYDITNSVKAYRVKDSQLAREWGGEIVFLDFQIPDNELEKRRITRNNQENSIKVSKIELKDWVTEPLSADEGKIFKICFSDMENSEKIFLDYLRNYFKNKK